MASINKSFNFRHGVQVDDDDFTVRGGLVGIGTTVPTERLDVRGNAVVSGLTSSISLQVTGVTTLTTVDIGITSIKSGIITASSGVRVTALCAMTTPYCRVRRSADASFARNATSIVVVFAMY